MNLDRRQFLGASAGLVIGLYVMPKTRVWAAQPERSDRPLPDANAFLRIGTDGAVTVLIAHS
ncbi:MAG TPA: hypothetical protein VKB80_21095, partial [Kofleriaceae bacterium]|nr:hypothetical protein [Kofleriaceae bacterium]